MRPTWVLPLIKYKDLNNAVEPRQSSMKEVTKNADEQIVCKQYRENYSWAKHSIDSIVRSDPHGSHHIYYNHKQQEENSKASNNDNIDSDINQYDMFPELLNHGDRHCNCKFLACIRFSHRVYHCSF
jgi:hypothetical protein